MAQVRYAIQHMATEWGYTSAKAYADPFNDIELDLVFNGPAGEEWRVPAFWAGGQEWRVRFAPPHPGTYRYRTICSDGGNASLHGLEGRLEAEPYVGDNELLRHGPLRVSQNRRYLEHCDGTPFFWLGDTWWMGLCKRLSWPDDFQLLVADRVAKGFTVIQIVAGPYPDMPAFDPRNENEAGQPWEEGFARVNPAYYDMADLRIRWLVRSGLMPCILGCWGYYLPWMGIEKMKRHWRNLIARYGAYPVVWCLAGEGAMPFYLSQDRERDRQMQIDGWTEIARYVRRVDPYQHPLTIHPTDSARDQLSDDSLLSFDMLQTGHGGYPAMGDAARRVAEAVARSPRMPVVNGEPCYEGIMEGGRQEVQRFLFWSNMLSGGAGHTYGANGIWQVNREEEPFGPSPHGASWGDRPWREAYRLPGSTHVGVGKRLLERYEWWRFQPHQEWVEPHAGANDYVQPYAAGIPGRVRLIYLPRAMGRWSPPVYVRGLEHDIIYRALLLDPKDGREHDLGVIEPDRDGLWRLPLPPIMQDWLLAIERAGS